jgi:D-alanine-D-alanine ligase
MDFILQKDTNKLYFLEVNTMPGQSESSIVPQQLRCAGIELNTFYNAILEDALNRAQK